MAAQFSKLLSSAVGDVASVVVSGGGVTDNSIPAKGSDNNSLVNASPLSSSSLILLEVSQSSNNNDSNSYNDESSNDRVGLQSLEEVVHSAEARVVNVELDEIDSFVITRSNVLLVGLLLLLPSVLLLRGM